VQLNRKVQTHTHEGATAKHVGAVDQLRRSVMSCLLWEREFYESGASIADRIASLVKEVPATDAMNIAIEARSEMSLRHVPLLIAREMARGPVEHRLLTGATLENIIQRPDELGEFLSIYWRDGRQPLSAQVKKGLAAAFTKFGAYALAKYNRDGAIKLRDVMFLSHPKPKDAEQEQMWKQLIDGTLAPPDTWEVKLSASQGKDKKASWIELLEGSKLGGMALLRNLRNMIQAAVPREMIQTALTEMSTARILPFRFISAARHAPQFEPELEAAMMRSLSESQKLGGSTILLVDVSGSMTWALSEKSEVRRMDAASGLAMILREICVDLRVFTFSNDCVEVPPRQGFALRDVIINSTAWAGTYLGAAVKKICTHKHDRLIVITDEQSHDRVPDPTMPRSYMINVASAKNGVGYGAWTHLDGWSESIARYIQALEASDEKSRQTASQDEAISAN